MSQKRYFYTDPLAAAWMAKHFGMEFITKDGLITRCVLPLVDGLKTGDCYYIHPGSLHLLEPKNGDLCRTSGFERIGNSGSQYNEYDFTDVAFDFGYGPIIERDGCGYSPTEIIQRDGKPFHWPQQEAV
ncbi:MAG: hypothetical protein K8U57_37025 [Planctomycetes bacterium]|nr:hypothetical protein [Planctomycetota bacterium]